MASIGNSNGVSFTGLGSGIDTNSLIEGLTKLNAQRIQALQEQKDRIIRRQTVFGELQAKLLDLQGKVGRLARSAGGPLDAMQAVSSDADALGVAASSTATAGTYTVTVNSLAKAHQVASEVFADPGTNIKQGTMSLQVGSGPVTTVTINSSNNTLQGLADAINAANGEVRATVVRDGLSSFRLLLTSTKAGAANTITVTNNLTSGSGASINPTNSTVQSASDAVLQIGTGSGAITVTSTSNRIENAIPGLSFDLKRADPTKALTIRVQPDTQGMVNAVQEFVDAYNGVVNWINDRSRYDPNSQQAGELLGQAEVNALLNDMSFALSASVPGLNPSANRLSTIGLRFDDKGRLQFDRSKFEDALAGRITGVTAADVKRLFALTGATDNPGVRFLTGGSKTKPSGATPYQVDVTAAATRATLTAGADLAVSTVIDGTNNTLKVRIDGRESSTLTLAHGTYSRSALAAAVQAAINNDPALAGASVIVDLDGDRLRITSRAYGSSSQVRIVSGTAVSSGVLGFSGGELASGTNVMGQFIVNGNPEPATGFGQILSGNTGNAYTEGLQVQVTLTPSQVMPGSEADLTVSRGVADSLAQVLNRYLDPVTGRLKNVSKRFEGQVEVMNRAIDFQNDLLEKKKESLLKQFLAMESVVNKLKLLGQQLTAQFQVQTFNFNNSSKR
jgi:flagellar hook-associated protein 2